jgi:hypothetical protein
VVVLSDSWLCVHVVSYDVLGLAIFVGIGKRVSLVEFEVISILVSRLFFLILGYVCMLFRMMCWDWRFSLALANE